MRLVDVRHAPCQPARRLGRRQSVQARRRPGDMSKKVKPAAKPKGAATAADESVVTRQTAFANYAKACKCVAVAGLVYASMESDARCAEPSVCLSTRR